MDNKKIKELLKTANKLVMSKKYEDTIKTCEEILSLDNSNYMALVFLGASQEGTSNCSEAFKSYRWAVEVDSNQALAWQGLGKLFDKAEKTLLDHFHDGAEFFIRVFEKLVDISKNDEDKKHSNEIRLCKLYSAQGKFDSSLELITNTSSSHQGGLFSALIEGQDGDMKLPEDSRLLELLKNIAKDVSARSDENRQTRVVAWVTHLKCLLKLKSSTDELWMVLQSKKNELQKCRFAEELELRIYLDTYPERSGEFTRSGVTDLEDDHDLMRLEKALQLMVDGELKEARSEFDAVLQKDRTLVSACRFQSECLHRLHCCKESSSLATRGLALLESQKDRFFGNCQRVKNELKVLIVKNNVQLNEASAWEEADAIITKLESENYDKPLEMVTLKCYLTLKMNDQERLEGLVGELRAAREKFSSSATLEELVDLNCCLGLLRMRDGEFEEAQDYFEKAIDAKTTDPKGHLSLGLLHWEVMKGGVKGEVEEVEKRGKKFIECMSKAIQLNRSNPLPYFYIGRYLSKMSDANTSKSSDFLMKAFDLDENNDQLIASSLVDHLLKIDDQESVAVYLNVILERMKNDCPKWVLLRLGAYHLKHGEVEEAIRRLQTAVGKDVRDMKSWERLGEAYLQRGSYTSALKAFTKVITNEPDALYSLYQIACIQQKLGQFTEAIEKLERVITLEPNYIPALYRLGDIGLESARQHMSGCIFGRAVLSLQMSINSLARACQLNPDLVCIWKCLGDVFSSFSGIPDSYICDVVVPEQLKNSSESIEVTNKLSLLVLGERSYSICLKQHSEDPNLWYDLGLNLHHQVKVQSRDVGSSMAKSSSLNSLARKAFQCLQRAATITPSDPTFWNALGVVSVSEPLCNYALGQHCFIKSIGCHGNNARAWSNLGFVYLVNKEEMLAHEAFKNAQSIEPLFVSSWIGQAMVAEEVMKKGVVGHLEAMDLFRHSVETDNNPEAFISYAHWVCSMVDEFTRISNDNNNHNNNMNNNSNKEWLEFTFKHLNAIDSALDAMAKYTASRPDCLRGWNYYGLLCEKQKLYRTAVGAFERCMKLLKDDVVDHKLHRKITLTNYARLLCKTGDYEDSQKHYDDLYDQLSSDFEDDVSLVEICHMALCHFKNKDYGRSFGLYEVALQMDSADEKKDEERILDQVHLAMGTCLMLQGKPDDAKHFMFQGIDISRRPLNEVLCSLLCVGLLQKELGLSNVVLNELHDIGGRSVAAGSPNLAFLSSRAKFLLSKSKNGYASIRDFLRAIRLRPDQSESWVRAAMFLLTNHIDGDVVDLVRSLCSAALSKQDKTCYQEALQCMAIISLKTSPIKPSLAPPDEQRKQVPAFSLAQKLVRLYPDQLTNWCILLASCQQQLVARQLEADDESQELVAFTLVTSKRVMDQVELASTYDRDNPYLKGMHRWLSRQHAIALIRARCLTEAEAFLQKVSWQYEDDKLLTSLMSSLNNDVDNLLWSCDTEENISKILASMIASGRMRNKRELFESHVEKTSWFNANQKLGDSIKILLQ